jgi:hypothetical protein
MANEITDGNERLGLAAIPLFRQLSPAALEEADSSHSFGFVARTNKLAQRITLREGMVFRNDSGN